MKWIWIAGLAACAAGQRTGPGSDFVQGEAGRLHVSDGGSGDPAVVLIHGLGGTLDVWRDELAHLRRSRRAVALDLRGHGLSDAPADAGGYSIDGLAADIEAVVHALSLRRVVLIGHSMAGCAMTRFAALHPELVAGLIYVDAIGDMHRLPPDVYARVVAGVGAITDPYKWADDYMTGKATPATREEVHRELGYLRPGAFHGLLQAMTAYPASADSEKYSGPAACIDAGVESPVFAHAMVARCRRTSLARVSHWLMVDDPRGFASAVDAVLANY
jgi:3-oxoadipate enol-lactonase